MAADEVTVSLRSETADAPAAPEQASRSPGRRSVRWAFFADPMIAAIWNPVTAAGRGAFDAVVARQAQIIAYIDDHKLLMIAILAVIPLLIVCTKASRGGGPDHIAGLK
jgi:hypothetical protein